MTKIIIKHDCFTSSGKTITFRDILWGEWEKMVYNPEIILRCIVSGKVESEEDFRELMMAILETVNIDKKRPSKDIQEGAEPDLHIIEGKMYREYHQPYSEVQKMPVRKIMLLLRDLKIVAGEEKWDPMRHSEKPDKKALRELKKMSEKI